MIDESILAAIDVLGIENLSSTVNRALAAELDDLLNRA